MLRHGPTISCPDVKRFQRAIAKIALPVIRAVRKFGHEVFGLHRTDREEPGYPEIDASSCGHPKGGHRAKNNSIRRPYASEKRLCEGRDDVVPQADSWAR